MADPKENRFLQKAAASSDAKPTQRRARTHRCRKVICRSSYSEWEQRRRHFSQISAFQVYCTVSILFKARRCIRRCCARMEFEAREVNIYGWYYIDGWYYNDVILERPSCSAAQLWIVLPLLFSFNQQQL
jgi:hypothetical protein